MTDARRARFSAAGGRSAVGAGGGGAGGSGAGGAVRVRFLVPAGFDDPGQPTGGNVYDQRACAGLAAAGWDVQVSAVAGSWPQPGPADLAGLAAVLAAARDGERVLADGLVAGPGAAQLLPHAGRLQVTVLAHMLAGEHDPAAREAERAVLRAAAGVVVTSEWTRAQVLSRYDVPARRVHVALPGADRAGAPPSPVRGDLICVAVLSHHKGQDVLVDALGALARTDWRCTLAGACDRDPGFVAQLRGRVAATGCAGRIRFAGVLCGAALRDAYATADLLVAPSRSETYGMAVTEALAHGVPVLASAAGGLPEAVGFAPDGKRPGELVPPGDSTALAAALSRWLGDEGHRRALRAAAWQRRSALPGWDQTARQIACALTSGGCSAPG